MGELFSKVVNMSFVASWVIFAVILLRLLLQKAPKWINCLLWVMVAVRLICPVSLESEWSLVPSAEILSEKVMTGPSFDVHTGTPTIDPPGNGFLGDHNFEGDSVSANHGANVTEALSILWLIGILILTIYALASYLRVYHKVRPSFHLRDNIWLCDSIATPFLLGFWKPRIYLPSGTEDSHMSYIIAHEKAHLKRHDHWWKPLGFLVLAVHWFNPLVWIAYILLCRDIELACDEKVIRDLEKKKASPIPKPCFPVAFVEESSWSALWPLARWA